MPKSKRRAYIPLEKKRGTWRQAKAKCEECGKPLIERKLVQVPSERIEFVVKVWSDHECWRCGAPGRLVFLFDNVEQAMWRYIDDRQIGEALERRFPFFYPGYSDTMETTYYANHCERCRALQGDHFLLDWLMEREGDGKSPDLTEPIPEVEVFTEPTSYVDRKFLPFHVHHADGDPSNNSQENLRILCPECHRKVHSEGNKSGATIPPRKELPPGAIP